MDAHNWQVRWLNDEGLETGRYFQGESIRTQLPNILEEIPQGKRFDIVRDGNYMYSGTVDVVAIAIMLELREKLDAQKWFFIRLGEALKDAAVDL